ncbi:hypothetical protein PQX77_002218, partial [Marasmius sp. AFHP31]
SDILVTTPNMLSLYRPPLNLCKVRMRCDRHFGVDDPLLYPQPFHREWAHLSIIQLKFKHLDSYLDVAWLHVEDKDFVESPGCGGFGWLDHRI